MLQKLLICGGSGMVIFEKGWVGKNTSSLTADAKWGGLICALEEFSVQCLDRSVSYMEFPTVGINMTKDDRTNLMAILFHDPGEQEMELGKLITIEVLKTFRDVYHDQDFSVFSSSTFSAFSNKLLDCVANTTQSLIYQRISGAALVYDDGTDAVAEGQMDDKLSVIANFQALQTIADQTLSIRDDETTYMCLELPRKSVYVHRVGNYASLVTICNNNVPTKDYYPNIEHTVRLLRKAFDFIYSYK